MFSAHGSSVEVKANYLIHIAGVINDDEKATINIPILECEIIISEVNFELAKPVNSKINNKNQRISVKFSENNNQQVLINIVKEYVVKVKYYIHF